MVIAIDIGNTNIVICGVSGRERIFSARLASDRNRTADQYAVDIQGILALNGIKKEDLEGGILSSVVPYLQQVIPAAFRMVTGLDLMIVGLDLNTGLNILVDDPRTVGADLIVGAAAALAKYPTPIAVFDMGTATTLTVLAGKNDLLGIMIIPGVKTALDALSANAAQLPYIDLSAPAKLIGTNTESCLLSGSVIGSAAMLDGIMDRLDKEMSEPVTAVLTGGIGPLIAPYCLRPYNLEPELLIDGLMLFYEMNKPKN